MKDLILFGDFIADPQKVRFWKELSMLMESLSLSFVDKILPSDTFTYLCPFKSK